MSQRIGRRQFLNQIAITAATITLGSRLSCSNETNQKRPNIFFAIADNWSWPHASIYGDKAVKTPAFDQVARNGILFTNAFASSASCTPSRGAILTGQHFWRLGAAANLWSSLPPQHRTYPNILEDGGYYVGAYGKGFRPGKNRERNETGPIYNSFKEFLENKPPEKPFCFWYGSHDPHRPYEWQWGIKDGINPQNVDVPPFLPDNEIVRTDFCDYFWEVQRFDREIGEQIKLLEQTGEIDNTLIVITSDNGCQFPRCMPNLYDYGMHVPLAVQWPNKIKKGQVVDEFINLIDLAPTFLEIAGTQIPPEMTGQTLIDIFERNGSNKINSSRDYVIFGRERHTPSQADHWGGYPMRGIRNKDFLYIHNFKPDRWPAGDVTSIRGPAYSDIDASPTKSYILEHRHDKAVAKFFNLACAKRPAEELYDLRKDKFQMNNVADDPEYSDVLSELRNQLMTQLKQTQDPRVHGDGDMFDEFPYYGPVENEVKK